MNLNGNAVSFFWPIFMSTLPIFFHTFTEFSSFYALYSIILGIPNYLVWGG